MKILGKEGPFALLVTSRPHGRNHSRIKRQNSSTKDLSDTFLQKVKLVRKDIIFLQNKRMIAKAPFLT